ncbi:pectinesterase family protein [Paenibacillus sp. XY044]|uniref:pectinesterase family protein n=1 Tax=Paenibacillus sp. XY044 TaxID=2026089 RepID=UPI000B9801F0|nr:pectinesterase family protein [Paenibacillus sp. XY044]OZB98231.1 pectin esterase [Paenibacillus sp. XY044]
MRSIVVDQNGNGDVVTVAEAIAAVPDHAAERTLIILNNGEYREKITVPASKTNLCIRGESRDGAVIVHDDSVSKLKPNGEKMTTYETATFTVLANGFHAEDLTFANSASRLERAGQAVALEAAGDRAIFRNVAILGHQDTLYTPGNGRQLYDHCYIEGTVDFVFGSATAVFKECELHNLNRHNGYVTAASTGIEQPYGYVLLQCRLTSSTTAETVSLGRPWKPYGSTIFVNTWMDRHIRPAGWDNWRDPSKEITSRYAEYGSTGPGALQADRVGWAKVLTEQSASTLSVSSVLAGEDGWNPEETSLPTE